MILVEEIKVLGEKCEPDPLWNINLLKTKRSLLYLKTQFLPRSKYF